MAEAVNEVLKLAEKALELAGEAKEPFLKTEFMVFAFLNIETLARAVLNVEKEADEFWRQHHELVNENYLNREALAEAQKQIASLAVYREAWERVAKCGTCIDRGEVVDHFNDLAEKHGLEKIER